MNNVEKAYQFFCKYSGHTKTKTTDIANRLDISYDDVVKGRTQFKEEQEKESIRGQTKDINMFEDSTEYPNKKFSEKTYNSLDEYLQDEGIDKKDVVQVYHKQFSDGTRYTVQTTFEKQQQIDKETLKNYLKNYTFEEVKPSTTYTARDSFAIFDLFDAHIDKLNYTGKGGYWEAKENAKYLLGECNKLLDDILNYKPEVIVLPIGNDFFNTNDANPATKKGTPQPTTMHWEDAFKIGVWFYRTLINMIIDKGCNVHAINIPGNHDKDKVFHLGEVIQALFEEHENVTLTMNKDKRKYIVYNKVLLGFAHGDVAKKKVTNLPTAMAIEMPEDWGRVNHRCWILGDIHHRETYKSLQTLEHNGVDIKFLRPATSADSWHTNEMWIGAKKSISYIVYRNSGSRITEDELFI